MESKWREGAKSEDAAIAADIRDMYALPIIQTHHVVRHHFNNFKVCHRKFFLSPIEQVLGEVGRLVEMLEDLELRGVVTPHWIAHQRPLNQSLHQVVGDGIILICKSNA